MKMNLNIDINIQGSSENILFENVDYVIFLKTLPQLRERSETLVKNLMKRF